MLFKSVVCAIIVGIVKLMLAESTKRGQICAQHKPRIHLFHVSVKSWVYICSPTYNYSSISVLAN